MVFLTLHEAVGEILQAYECVSSANAPFFFMIGAGVSAPAIPVASKIVAECQEIVRKRNDKDDGKPAAGMDAYSYWLAKAYAQPKQRTSYLKSLIEGKRISQANFRLAHLLLGENPEKPKFVNMVITTNFDDHLSRALTLFGKHHIVCDHPATTQRIDDHDPNGLYLVHVHGSYHFYDCKNLSAEITQAARSSSQTNGTMASLLDRVLSASSPLVVGYSGWEQDVFMNALKRRLDGDLPYNLYWFCYRRNSPDSLPDWLKNHPNIRFVVPEEKARKHSQSMTIGDTTNKVVSFLMSVASAGVARDYKESVLDARTVFEALNYALDLSVPELTRDPLQFFIKKLHETFPEEDVGGKDDLYKLKSVIERIEQARKSCEERAPDSAQPESPLEPIRDAIRRSDYENALSLLLKLAPSKLLDDSSGELIATAFEIANALSKLGKYNEELDVYEEVVRRYGDASEVALREQVAKALVSKGFVLGQLGRNIEELAVYEDVIRCYGDASEVTLREQVAKALVNKGVTLGQMGQGGAEIAVYDEVVGRYGDASEAGLRERVSDALINKGFNLLCEAKRVWQGGDEQSAQALLARALVDIVDSLKRMPDEPIALGNQGYILFLQGQTEAAKEILVKAIQLGGEKLRQVELADADIHPLPQDEAFKKLLNSL